MEEAKYLRANSMFSQLLDLEHPVITNRMVAFLEQNGVYRVFLNFITRRTHFPDSIVYDSSPEHSYADFDEVQNELDEQVTHQIFTAEELDPETIAMMRSFKAVELLSNPSCQQFRNSIESHLPELLEILFYDSFSNEAVMHCNFFHFMKLIENLLSTYRLQVFSILRKKNLIEKMIPHIGKHPIIGNCILYLVEMSEPATSSSTSSLYKKLKLQIELARRNLLMRVLEMVYKPAESDTGISVEDRCDAACELFVELVDELCYQEKGREAYVADLSKQKRSPSPEVLSENDSDNEDSSFSPRAILQRGVGDLLATLVTSANPATNDNYIVDMLSAIDNYSNSYTCRKCSIRILQFLVDRTYGRAKKSAFPEANLDVEEQAIIVGSIRQIHEFLMQEISSQFPLLCRIVIKEHQLAKSEPIDLSAYTVRNGFSILRIYLVQLLLQVIRYSYLCNNSESSVLLVHVEETKDSDMDIFKVLVDWFFEYRYNNMFHNIFTDLMAEIIYACEEAVLWCILSKHKFLSRAIQLYNDTKVSSDNRGHILHIFNLLRLTADTLERTSYLFRFLDSHQLWKEFQPTLISDTLREICKTDEREIQIGSEFAEELGFDEADLYQKADPNLDTQEMMNEDEEDLDEFEYKE